MSVKKIIVSNVSDNFYEKKILKLVDDDFNYDLNIFDKERLLHRYRNISEYTFSDLLNDEITFTSPELFNDPYDGSFMYTPKIKVSLKYEFRPNGGTVTKGESTKGELAPAGERIIDNSLQKFIKNLVRVACFSEQNSNEVMWSHYANQAKGIVLSYSINELEELMKENNIKDYVIAPVFYQNHKLFFNPISKDTDEKKMVFYMNKVMLLKNKGWVYEDEWRLIFSTINEERFSKKFVRLKGIKPKKIILGENTSHTYARIIKDIAREKRIDVFQAKTTQKSNTRELKIEKIF
jgi:hypothetical protein